MKLDSATFIFIAFAVMLGAFTATKAYDYTRKMAEKDKLPPATE